MTLDFQSWMRAVWMSLIEPADIARQIGKMKFEARVMWMALGLTAILNVLLVSLLQIASPAPVMFQGQVIVLSPFAYTAVLGVFLVLFVYAIHYSGRFLEGQGTLPATLTMMVWFQAVSLTLEAGQFILVLLSPSMAAIFGMISLGALIWCIVNFVNVLHSFDSLGKAVLTLLIALIGTAFGSGLVLALLGVGAQGGTA